MRDFVDELIDTILEQEKPRINNIMKEVTDKVSKDLLQKTLRLLDSYYDNYTPVNYVRLYEPKRKLKSKAAKRKSKGYTIRKPKSGGISLHTAIGQMQGNDLASISIGDFDSGYTGGIIFDGNYFRSHMRHPGSGITGWNIVENFLFSASDGVGNHPSMQRSVNDEDGSGEADFLLDACLDKYDAKIDKFYKDALNKY